MTKRMGGSFGWRGKGYGEMRKRILWLSRGRSSATGSSQMQSTLEVDHIDPYRVGGTNPMTNSPLNLRVLDQANNAKLDYAQGFQEKPARRRLRAF